MTLHHRDTISRFPVFYGVSANSFQKNNTPFSDHSRMKPSWANESQAQRLHTKIKPKKRPEGQLSADEEGKGHRQRQMCCVVKREMT